MTKNCSALLQNSILWQIGQKLQQPLQLAPHHREAFEHMSHLCRCGTQGKVMSSPTKSESSPRQYECQEACPSRSMGEIDGYLGAQISYDRLQLKSLRWTLGFITLCRCWCRGGSGGRNLQEAAASGSCSSSSQKPTRSLR